MANNINMYRFPIDFLTCLIFKLMSNFKEMKKALALVGLLGVISCNTNNQDTPAVVGDNTEGIRDYKTYCNPIDIDYSYMSHYRAENKVSYRSGADRSGKFLRDVIICLLLVHMGIGPLTIC